MRPLQGNCAPSAACLSCIKCFVFVFVCSSGIRQKRFFFNVVLLVIVLTQELYSLLEMALVQFPFWVAIFRSKYAVLTLILVAKLKLPDMFEARCISKSIWYTIVGDCLFGEAELQFCCSCDMLCLLDLGCVRVTTGLCAVCVIRLQLSNLLHNISKHKWLHQVHGKTCGSGSPQESDWWPLK